MKKYFYEETGMYIDWQQLDKLPQIDTLIDVGVGPKGTPDLYEKFKKKKLLLIDPLDEAESFFKEEMTSFDAKFYKIALGSKTESATINVENQIGRSTILDVADINYEGDPVDQRLVSVARLDDVLSDQPSLGRVGLKIDTEGYELNVIRGAEETLKATRFVIAEVRHNHESFKGVYKLHEFVKEMHDQGFVLSMIITAKPFIADLCFEPVSDLFV